jgi:hypothetical protein
VVPDPNKPWFFALSSAPHNPNKEEEEKRFLECIERTLKWADEHAGKRLTSEEIRKAHTAFPEILRDIYEEKEEQRFVKYIEQTLKWADEHADGKSLKSEEIRKARTAFAKILRDIATKFIAGKSVLRLLMDASYERGKYNATRKELRSRYTVVDVKIDNNNLAVDIDFNTRGFKFTSAQETLIT